MDGKPESIFLSKTRTFSVDVSYLNLQKQVQQTMYQIVYEFALLCIQQVYYCTCLISILCPYSMHAQCFPGKRYACSQALTSRELCAIRN